MPPPPKVGPLGCPKSRVLHPDVRQNLPSIVGQLRFLHPSLGKDSHLRLAEIRTLHPDFTGERLIKVGKDFGKWQKCGAKTLHLHSELSQKFPPTAGKT